MVLMELYYLIPDGRRGEHPYSEEIGINALFAGPKWGCRSIIDNIIFPKQLSSSRCLGIIQTTY
jgi:hypothetical protein